MGGFLRRGVCSLKKRLTTQGGPFELVLRRESEESATRSVLASSGASPPWTGGSWVMVNLLVSMMAKESLERRGSSAFPNWMECRWPPYCSALGVISARRSAAMARSSPYGRGPVRPGGSKIFTQVRWNTAEKTKACKNTQKITPMKSALE